MANIVLTSGDLYNVRPAELPRLLQRLRDGEVPIVQVRHGAGIVLTSRDERRREGHFRDWRFQALPPSRVWFNYFEVWRPIDKGRAYCLSQAYLHLYVKNPDRRLVPLVCLHTDPEDAPQNPEDEDEVRVSRYKQGPHVHVELAEHPLNRCHFPLNFGHLNAVLASVSTLTAAMQAGIEIIRHEVISRYSGF
jgi:hypothetical protein